jgi:hypothetical protein
MKRIAVLLSAAFAFAMMSVATAQAVELDPKIIGFKLPDQSSGPTTRAATVPRYCKAIRPNPAPTPCC